MGGPHPPAPQPIRGPRHQGLRRLASRGAVGAVLGPAQRQPQPGGGSPPVVGHRLTGRGRVARGGEAGPGHSAPEDTGGRHASGCLEGLVGCRAAMLSSTAAGWRWEDRGGGVAGAAKKKGNKRCRCWCPGQRGFSCGLEEVGPSWHARMVQAEPETKAENRREFSGVFPHQLQPRLLTPPT